MGTIVDTSKVSIKMSTNEVTKVKLTYFDFGGKAESIRLALTAVGIPFEDFRFKSREEFIDMKESGKLNFGQVPMLEVWTNDGEHHVLTQSAALMRYVAKLGALTHPEKPQLYPVNDFVLAAKVDAIMDQEADALCGIRVAKYTDRFGHGYLNDEKHKDLADSIIRDNNNEVIPRHLAFLQNQLKSNGSTWLAGTEGPSIADYFWIPILRLLEGGYTGDKTLLSKFLDLSDLIKRFMELPVIKEYYKNNTN